MSSVAAGIDSQAPHPDAVVSARRSREDLSMRGVVPTVLVMADVSFAGSGDSPRSHESVRRISPTIPHNDAVANGAAVSSLARRNKVPQRLPHPIRSKTPLLLSRLQGLGTGRKKPALFRMRTQHVASQHTAPQLSPADNFPRLRRTDL